MNHNDGRKTLEELRVVRNNLDNALARLSSEDDATLCVVEGRLETAQWAITESINLLRIRLNLE